MTWHLCPGTKVATCDVNMITRFNTRIGPKCVGRPFSLGARLSSKTSSVQPTLSRWRPIKEKWRVPFSSKCRNSGNNGRNCTIFGPQGYLRCSYFSYFHLGVTPCDLSMTLSVFKQFWRKCTLAPKLLGLE